MLKEFKADLHIHTCLSPCAELEMSPRAIVKTALEKGIDIIAITDHNSAENVIAAKKAARDTGLTVLSGMEITTSEEAHILALFDDIESIIKLQDIIYKNLMPGENDEKRFGEQIVVNEKDEVLDFNRRLLIAATELSVYSAVNTIHSLGGLSIASHIDKEVFSVISQLGFIPDNVKFNALEMSCHMDRKRAEELFVIYNSYAWISSSDAHYLDDIGKRTTTFVMNEPTTEDMVSAFNKIGERRVVWG
jgi:PHP family Zn ribbon phosphoesterase